MINSDLEWWKAQAGRVPLLEPGEEITLGRQVQELIQLEERLDELREEMTPCADGAAPGEDQLAQAAGLTPAQLRRRLRAGRRAKDRMITGNLRLVISYVLNLRREVLVKYSPEDLISAGNEGLIRAVEKFDPQRGYKFSTYAYWWIRQAVTKHQHINDHIVSQANCRAEHRRIIGQAIQTLTAELRRHPSEAEIRGFIIESGRLSAAQISEAVASGRPIMALDQVVGDDTNTLVDLIAAPDTGDPEAEELAWRLDHLPPNLRQLTIRSWGLDGARPWTIPEAALAMGVSRAQISRDRQRAMRLLRLPPQSRPCRPQSPENRPPPETDQGAGWSVIGQESIPLEIAQDGSGETLGGDAPARACLDQFIHQPLVSGEELTALHVESRQTAQPVRGSRHQLIRREPLDLPDSQLQLPIILNSPSTHA